MKLFLSVLTMLVLISGCSNRIEPPLEKHVEQEKTKLSGYGVFPPVFEILSMGLYSDKEDDIKAERKSFRENKYVTDENDDRSFIKRSVATLSLGIIGRKETKLNHDKRLKEEAEFKKLLVTDENDDRGFVAHTFNLLSFGLIANKEANLERTKRLEKEVEEAKDPDQRGLFTKSLDVFSFGTITPGKPVATYHKDVVMNELKLGQLKYGVSKYDDVVNVLGEPIRLTIYVNETKVGLFKVYAETYKYIPYMGTPQRDVSLNFDVNDVLVKIKNAVVAEKK